MAALYQQARPFTFEQVVGQEHVKDVLTAALARSRLGHAYLFSGPRGVGKTTTARLLAMAVNCEHPDAGTRPCGACESCLLVRRNHHPDVTELDAASNNSVDDVRDLREKVRLASMRGGRRVWVLDEAHMLSRAASNALLKTLEEPPPNLVFILATTEPEKLPATILSRCQHFRFRRLSEDEIASKLSRLCAQEGSEADADALALVARAADGAMRDAESLLERLLTSGERITRDAVEAALGLPPQDRMRALAQSLAGGDVQRVFDESSALYHDGFAPSSLAEQLTRTFRDALYAQVSGDPGFALPLATDELLRVIHALDDEADRFSRRDDLFSLEVALIKTHNALHRATPDAAAPQGEARVTAARPEPLTLEPVSPEPLTPESVTPKSVTPESVTPKSVTPEPQPPAIPDFDPHTAPRQPKAARPEPMASAPSASAAPAPVSWHKVKTEASAQLKAFLQPAEDTVQGHVIRLSYGERHKFHFGEAKKRLDELAALIAALYGGGFELVLEGPGDTVRKKF